MSEKATAAGRCPRWGCEKAALVWMRKGDARQTFNGFLIAKIAGWYCPVCAAGYGGERNTMKYAIIISYNSFKYVREVADTEAEAIDRAKVALSYALADYITRKKRGAKPRAYVAPMTEVKLDPMLKQ